MRVNQRASCRTCNRGHHFTADCLCYRIIGTTFIKLSAGYPELNLWSCSAHWDKRGWGVCNTLIANWEGHHQIPPLSKCLWWNCHFSSWRLGSDNNAKRCGRWGISKRDLIVLVFFEELYLIWHLWVRAFPAGPTVIIADIFVFRSSKCSQSQLSI